MPNINQSETSPEQIWTSWNSKPIYKVFVVTVYRINLKLQHMYLKMWFSM